MLDKYPRDLCPLVHTTTSDLAVDSYDRAQTLLVCCATSTRHEQGSAGQSERGGDGTSAMRRPLHRKSTTSSGPPGRRPGHVPAFAVRLDAVRKRSRQRRPPATLGRRIALPARPTVHWFRSR